MTNYFKLYLKPREGGWEREKIKKAEDVRRRINGVSRTKYQRYMVVKRLKRNTDVPVGRGKFTKECVVTYVDNLDVDYRVIGANVVVYDKYIEAQKLEMEGEER